MYLVTYVTKCMADAVFESYLNQTKNFKFQKIFASLIVHFQNIVLSSILC